MAHLTVTSEWFSKFLTVQGRGVDPLGPYNLLQTQVAIRKRATRCKVGVFALSLLQGVQCFATLNKLTGMSED